MSVTTDLRPPGRAPAAAECGHVSAALRTTRLGHTVTFTPRPRGLLCLVHGMGMTGAYFSTHADREADLTSVATDAGYVTLAPDRPGYGRSAHLPCRSPAEQARAVEELLVEYLDVLPSGLPVILLGHSLGGRIALEIAAGGRLEIAGLEISAAGYRLRPGVDAERADGRRAAWGPPACYPPETFALARDVVAPVPDGELVAGPDWGARFREAAAGVTCPVRFSFAEHDRWWRCDAEEVASIEACFPRSPWITTSTLLSAGHNLHLGVHAREHNRQSVSFLQRCLEEHA